jgi:hypothetical protein
MSRQAVSALMAEVGPVGDFLAIDEYAAENLWRIAVDEQAIVEAELDEPRGVLVLSAEIAPCPAERRGELADLLLRYNQIWDATGGARLGVDGENNIWLMQDLAAGALDVAALCESLKTFSVKAAGWREIAERFPLAEAHGAETLDLLSTPGLIRS